VNDAEARAGRDDPCCDTVAIEFPRRRFSSGFSPSPATHREGMAREMIEILEDIRTD